MLKETLTPYIVYMAMNLHWLALAAFSLTAILAYFRARSIWMRRRQRIPGYTSPHQEEAMSSGYTFDPEDMSRLSQEFYAKHIQNLSERHPSLLVRQLATEMRCMSHNHQLELQSAVARPRVIQVGLETIRIVELAEEAWSQTEGPLELDKRRFINNLRRLVYHENLTRTTARNGEDLLHLESPKVAERTAGGNQVIMDRSRDRKDDQRIFRCSARDNHVVIAEEVYREIFSGGNHRMFRILSTEFDPVGPDVARALKLSEHPESVTYESPELAERLAEIRYTHPHSLNQPKEAS